MGVRETEYQFKPVTSCNMCGANSSKFKRLGKRLDKSQKLFPIKKQGRSIPIFMCRNCGLVFSNPQPIPRDLQDHYGVSPEQYWSPEYFEIKENYFRSEIETLQKLTSHELGLKTLDIGAGVGKQMIALKKSGYETYGIEPSVPFYQMAIEKMGIEQDHLKCISIEAAEYDQNTFDFISFGVVLEHLYDPSAAIIKAMKWLKPQGVVHIEVPSSRWLIGKLINTYYKLSFQDFVGNLSPMHEPFHLYEFGLESFKQHAKKNDYTIAHHEYYVCQTFLPKVFDRIVKPYMKHTDQGMQFCVWLRKN